MKTANDYLGAGSRLLFVFEQILVVTFISMVVRPAIASESDQDSIPYFTNACSPKEKWVWPNLPSNFLGKEEFAEFLAGKTRLSAEILEAARGIDRKTEPKSGENKDLNAESYQVFTSAVISFSDALSVRRLAQTEAQRAFSEYWISLSLFRSGLIDLAYPGFNVLANQDVTLETLPFQLAALECISVIHRTYPAFGFPRKADDQLSKMNAELRKLARHSSAQASNQASASTAAILKEKIPKIALTLILSSLSGDGDKNKSQILSLLEGSGVYESLGNAVYFASKNSHSKTIDHLRKFFADPESESDLIKPYSNHARLLLARVLFSTGKYQQATEEYKKISPRSNERVHALSEMAWSYLMANEYREAIGTAIGLQSGSFKRTFAPEVLMVMAMGLNEICRYPESMSVINNFRIRYKSAYDWLKSQGSKPKSDSLDYYREAIHFAKKSPKLSVPAEIASEWVRSPIFIANQERINLLVDEKNRAEGLSTAGKNQQRILTIGLTSTIRKLREQFRLAKIKMKPGENVYDHLPSQAKASMEITKYELNRLRHLRAAGPFWRKMLTNYQVKIPVNQGQAMSNVRQEFSRLNQRMLNQLFEIAENNELIEVEILNGASEDMIWQNAHEKEAEAIRNAKVKANVDSDKVWDWGTTQGGLEGSGEVWEDEEGSMSAQLYDNCKSKNKYIGVEKGKAS